MSLNEEDSSASGVSVARSEGELIKTPIVAVPLRDILGKHPTICSKSAKHAKLPPVLSKEVLLRQEVTALRAQVKTLEARLQQQLEYRQEIDNSVTKYGCSTITAESNCKSSECASERLRHAHEIAARKEAELEWTHKEAFYQEQIRVLTKIREEESVRHRAEVAQLTKEHNKAQKLRNQICEATEETVRLKVCRLRDRHLKNEVKLRQELTVLRTRTGIAEDQLQEELAFRKNITDLISTFTHASKDGETGFSLPECESVRRTQGDALASIDEERRAWVLKEAFYQEQISAAARLREVEGVRHRAALAERDELQAQLQAAMENAQETMETAKKVAYLEELVMKMLGRPIQSTVGPMAVTPSNIGDTAAEDLKRLPQVELKR